MAGRRTGITRRTWITRRTGGVRRTGSVRLRCERYSNADSLSSRAGKSESLKNYLAAMSRFHRYSWGNVLLISAQRPDATQVAGFHTWHDLGRWVKKGEKGIMIFAPMLVREKDATHPYVAGGETKSDQIFRLAGFRTAYVFDRLSRDFRESRSGAG